MAFPRRMADERDPVVLKLVDGHYDRELAEMLDRQIAAVIAQSRRKTLAEVDGRSLPIRLRDGIARLFSPYL